RAALAGPVLIAALSLVACSSDQKPAPAQPVAAPRISIGQLPAIDAEGLLAHTKELPSDEYEGGAPGSKGEELSVTYVAVELKQAELTPGITDRTFYQKAPLVGITPAPAPLVFAKGSQKQTLKWKDDVVAWTKHVAPSASLDKSDLVFVGYGVVAPEFNW